MNTKNLFPKNVREVSFRPYGRVLDLRVDEFVEIILESPAIPKGRVVYEPSVKKFEMLSIFNELTSKTFGEMPIEFGHCSGFNNKLNALEYHRSSEIDIAATDLILMLGHRRDIDYKNFTYDTDKVEMFFVPAGVAVELYATTLHYAPCGIDGKEFRCGVVLPRGTNENLSAKPDNEGENKLLFAVNKWLISHKESNIENSFVGLVGKNLEI